MAKCDFCEIRGWGGKAFCLKKDNYVDNSTYDNYCNSYRFDDCPIYKGGSSGGCYLTTACVQYRGLTDDCLELSTLREFRDEYLATTKNGKEEIQEYYMTAPMIVNAINNSGECEAVYEMIYSSIILPCIKLINEGHYEEVHQRYRDMVRTLEKKYC